MQMTLYVITLVSERLSNTSTRVHTPVYVYVRTYRTGRGQAYDTFLQNILYDSYKSSQQQKTLITSPPLPNLKYE